MAVAVTIDTTLGFLFHAVAVCCLLYGAGCMQGWFYFRRYRQRDGWVVQSLVATVLLADTCQIGLLYAAVYKYAVTHQADPLALTHVIPELIVELIFSGLIAFAVQLFYCFRIYTLSKNFYIVAFVSLCSLASYATLLYFVGVVLTQYTELSQLALQDDISIVTNVFGLVTDLSISLFMVFFLQRSKTGFRRTTDMLNRLIIFTFNTGLPTSICSILTVILLEAAPGTFIYIFIYVTMGRFYTNCLLVTLNSRDYIRSSSDQPTSEGFAMSIPANLNSRLEPLSNTSTHRDPIAVRIEQTTQNFPDSKRSHSYTDGDDIEQK